MLRSITIVDTARELYPVKTAAQLAGLTGYPQRTVEYWLQGDKKIPSDALIALLHSDHGREFLAGVMADATPRWWLRLRAYLQSINLAVAKRNQAREMKALLDGDFGDEISDAALLSDEEFHRPKSAKVHALDRALVGRKGKAR